MTTQKEIRGWLDIANLIKATHVIVVVDKFDWQDFPVYVNIGEDVKVVMKQYDNTASYRIMEIYNMSMDLDEQMKEGRAFNL